MLTPNHVSYWRLTPNHIKFWHSFSFSPIKGERKKLASFSIMYVQYFTRIWIRIRFFMTAGSGSVEYRPGSATLIISMRISEACLSLLHVYVLWVNFGVTRKNVEFWKSVANCYGLEKNSADVLDMVDPVAFRNMWSAFHQIKPESKEATSFRKGALQNAKRFTKHFFFGIRIFYTGIAYLYWTE